jgi:hypothetical protein
LKVFRAGRPVVSGVVLNWIGGGLLVMLSAFFALGAFVASDWKIPAAFAGGCLGLALLSFGCAWYRVGERKELNRQQRCYVLCADALVLREAGSSAVLRWRDLVEYQKGLDSLKLTTGDGRTISVSADVENFNELVRDVIARITEGRLPALLDRIAQGETVEAGILGVSRHGLVRRGELIAWDQIAELRLVSLSGSIPELQVKRFGTLLPWCSVDMSRVPNYEVVVELLQRVCPPRLLRPA